MTSNNDLRNVYDSIHWWEAFFNVFKSTIGTGILTLPEAFLTAGMVSGSIGLVFVATVCILSLNLLLDANKWACKKLEVSALSYGDLVEFAFSENSVFRRISHLGKFVANLIIFMFQFLVCCAYIRITAETFNDFIVSVFGTTAKIPFWTLILLMELPFGAIAVVRNMRIVSVFSGMALLLLAICLLSIFTEITTNLHSPKGLPLYTNFWMTALLIGRVIYSMESIATILPIENKMKRPEHFRMVLNVSFILITFIYLAFALIGFIKYRFKVADVVTVKLPHNLFFIMIRGLFGVTILLTYSIQFYAVIMVMTPVIVKYVNGNNALYVASFITATVQVVVAGLLPNIGLALSFIGGSCGAVMYVIFPPLVAFLMKLSDASSSTLGKIFYLSYCGIIFVFGCFITYFSTYVAVAEF